MHCPANRHDVGIGGYNATENFSMIRNFSTAVFAVLAILVGYNLAATGPPSAATVMNVNHAVVDFAQTARGVPDNATVTQYKSFVDTRVAPAAYSQLNGDVALTTTKYKADARAAPLTTANSVNTTGNLVRVTWNVLADGFSSNLTRGAPTSVSQTMTLA